jgi:hypothetical protein
MTAYHGGKQRIGKEIANIIYKKSMKISRLNNFKIKGYCEPFCGMLGVYQHIPRMFASQDSIETKKIKFKASDINESVIKMWKKVQKGWLPKNKNITKEEYLKLKYRSPSAMKGFMGHQCSFGGKFFQHYVERRCKNFNNAIKNIKKISNEITKIKFSNKSYEQYKNLKNYIIYCDPPYSEYSDYYDINYKRIKFDSLKFWKWCLKMSKNNLVFVSEYNYPRLTKIKSSTKSIKKLPQKSIQIKNLLNIKTKISYGTKGKVKQNTEKLFFLQKK